MQNISALLTSLGSSGEGTEEQLDALREEVAALRKQVNTPEEDRRDYRKRYLGGPMGPKSPISK